MHRKIGEIQQQRNRWDEDEPLQKAILGGTLRKIPDSRHQSETQRHNQNGEKDKGREEIKRIPSARISHRFFITLV